MRIKSLLFSFCFISFTEFPFQGPLAVSLVYGSPKQPGQGQYGPSMSYMACCLWNALPAQKDLLPRLLAAWPAYKSSGLASRGTSGPCGVSNSGQWRKGAGGWRWVPVSISKQDSFEGEVLKALCTKRTVQKRPKV